MLSERICERQFLDFEQLLVCGSIETLNYKSKNNSIYY
jgi:hypothetical protein